MNTRDRDDFYDNSFTRVLEFASMSKKSKEKV